MPSMLLFFDISGGELLIILLAAFIVFGPSRIPEIARKIGRGMNEIRRASDEIKREINKESRKMEKEAGGEGSFYRDIKKTADEIRKDFEDVSEPLKNSTDHPSEPGPKGPAPAENNG